MTTMYSVRVWVLENMFPERDEMKLPDRDLPRTVHTIDYGYKDSHFDTVQQLIVSVYLDWERHTGPFERPATLGRSPIPGDYIELTECVSDKPLSFLYRIDKAGFSLVQISQMTIH